MKISVEQSLADPGARQRQQREAKRVMERARELVVEFCTLRLFDEFRMSDLIDFVRTRDRAIAPDSISRVLRFLRADGTVSYRVTNRSESRYVIESVDTDSPRRGQGSGV